MVFYITFALAKFNKLFKVFNGPVCTLYYKAVSYKMCIVNFHIAETFIVRDAFVYTL